MALAPGAALVANYGTVEILLKEDWARRVLLLVCLAAACLLSVQAGELWLADRRVDSQDLERMDRGTALVPGNADAWDRLGRFRQWSFADPDPSGAIADYQKAVEVDPLSSYYWMDLAGALEAAGEDEKARSAYAQAKTVYPLSAQVAWNYGNFLLRQQEYSEGYAEIQKAVRADPTLIPLAISRVWRSSEDVNVLLDNVLPADVNAYFLALDFFGSNHQMDAELIVWQRLLTLGKPIALSQSFPFLEELIREDRASDAQRFWLQAVATSGLGSLPSGDSSVVWNGNFTQDFANGGLGWRWDSPLGVAMGFEPAPLSLPGRALRLDFGGGTNLQLQSPSQYIPVEPDRAYHFRAYIRTSGLTTESGVRFLIADPHHPGELTSMTDNLTGTNPWTAVDADIKTGTDTRFLLICPFRSPSRLFDNKLSGTVWIAGISLVPSAAAAVQATR